MARRSMTAYGRASGGGYQIEIHSVNRKGLEINLSLPRELLFCDIEIRNTIKKSVHRGTITVRVNREKGESLDCELPSKEALSAISNHFIKIGFNKSEVTLPFLCERYNEVSIAPSEPDSKGVLKGLSQAISELIHMKQMEAEHLANDIKARLSALQSGVKSLKKLAQSAPQALRQKLNDRLKSLNISQEDVAKEVVLFAEKCDVTEEIVRLNSHFSQFDSLLKSKEIAIGRTLDFLLVEMIRELNTIGAKAFLHEMTDTIPFLKAEAEKIREQVQNIE